MTKKKVTKASKRRLLLFGSVSVVIIVYFLVSLFTYMSDIYNLKREEYKLTQDLIELQGEEKELDTQIDMLKDEDYLARYARENYLYSKDGEIVLKIQANNKDKIDADDKFEFDPKYVFYIGGGIIGILILYVLLKKAK